MDIFTVRNNLKTTIAGKEEYLRAFRADDNVITIVKDTMIQVIEMNIAELKVILGDVEKCCERASADSWKGSVDRQGGSFSPDEINDGGRWI
jgi:hypothetical protein